MARIESRHLTTALIIIVIGFVATASNLKLRAFHEDWTEPKAEKVEKWNPRLFQLLTFGHAPTATDWLWINALQDGEIARVKPGTHPSFFFDMDLATDLDPAFYEVYYAGANLLAVVRGDGPGALTLLLKGEKFRKEVLPTEPPGFRERFWPYEWQVPLLLAYVYLFEMNDMSHASSYFIEAATNPGSPEYLKKLSSRLNQPGGTYEVGIRLLNFMVTTQKDEVVRNRLLEKRKSLFIGQYLFHLNEDFRQFLGEQNGYKSKDSFSSAQMQEYWRRFLKQTRTPDQDPLGGKISLKDDGKAASSTPHESVFGLE